jgi:hypothetical protein
MGMPVPVINKTQSALTFGLGQPFSFSFSATNSPTEWAILPEEVIPHGFVFNTKTGVLSGSGQMPGIWIITLTASNGDGDSVSEVFTIGVFDTAGRKEIFKSVSINTDTWVATFPDPATARAADVVRGLVALEASATQARYGDDLLLKITFTSGGSEAQLPLVGARFAMKGMDTEAPFLTTSEGSFRRTSSIAAGQFIQNYWLHVSMENPALSDFLMDYENDITTEVNVSCELEMMFERPETAAGPLLQKVTTVPFLMRVRRDSVR